MKFIKICYCFIIINLLIIGIKLIQSNIRYSVKTIPLYEKKLSCDTDSESLIEKNIKIIKNLMFKLRSIIFLFTLIGNETKFR